jgi:uncharacterized membrane protein YgcG
VNRFRRRLRFSVLALGLACAIEAAGKELHWSSMDVKARLDAEGALHVVERQAMVFTGDWNGGERVFRVFPGQTLGFESLRRLEPDGTVRELSKGDLSAVDQFSWPADKTLRWRSRLPSDPQFENTEIVYELVYTLYGILVKQGDRYLLDHDFAFPDRAGTIEKFTLSLELDPVWKPERPFSGLSLSALRPGESAVVKLVLEHTGAGQPVAGRTVASPVARWIAVGLLAAAIVLLYLRFRSREAALGRFTPLTPPEAIDEAWLEANLLSLSPEEAGALWDEKIGPPEVAAVLARLAAEKKISTAVDGKKLSMRLLVPVERLDGYDEDLLRAFFFGGRKETDTDAVRKHYKSSGFDPVSKIKPGLEARLKKHPDFQDEAPRPSRWPTIALFATGAAALALAVVGGGQDGGEVVGIGIVHGILFLIGVLCAVLFQKRIDRVDFFSMFFLWFPVLLLYFAWTAARDGVRSSLLVIAGVLLLRLAIVNSVFNIAKIRSGSKRIARRKALASARNYFARELSRSEPRLKDDWFPYVVAFGLTGEADRWFRAHGAAAAGAGSRAWSGSTSSSSSSSSSSSGSGSWSGGGGAFGGAGASGTWAVAAGAMAAGVSAPSSSSSGGGGGGGGGGSSGGGGGGGW